ncbi:osmotic stress induced protein [Scheffersomyces coipomensis]|uniref:osmotic stress induced protein n=1 Tax=Scheffersomyces coipomensis TaxID=1788519 RepID=UPI00315DF86B
MSAQTVFVTGATGYIAQHIILQLLKKGYHVIGQVRSVAKGEALEKDFSDKNFSFEIVEVLEKDGAFDVVLTKHPEVTVFLHTASPFTLEVEDNEKDMIIPAVNGTKNVLVSIKRFAPQIKRVVVTSSLLSAISFAELIDPKFRGSEDDWHSVTLEEGKNGDLSAAYPASKKFAELAAWDFVKDEKPNFQLSTILPGSVFGPQAFESGVSNLHLSAAMVAKVLKLKRDDAIPDIVSIAIDVRDIALAHILAFEKEEAAGQRIVGAAHRFIYSEIVDIIRRNFTEFDCQLPPTEKLPNNFYDKWVKFDDVKSRKTLGIEYIPLEKTVIDSITQILDYNKKHG